MIGTSFFKDYTSATLAGGGTQTVFLSNGEQIAGRVYNKVYVEGRFGFSFLFANVTDSTFSDGSKSVRNMAVGPWRLIGASVAVSDCCDPVMDMSARTRLLFDGAESKNVAEGEIFCSDPVELSVKSGQYVSVEVYCAGRMLPCHAESIVPVYRLTKNGWKPDAEIPIPAMTGCTRKVRSRVCFWGDSITQGIGTPVDSYLHYAAKTAELIGYDDVAYWDLGLGFARANDAASCGVWMEKAKTNDIVSVCFGVNDINRGSAAEQIECDLVTIVSELKGAGCRVLLQTVPPFDHEGRQLEIWNEVNRFILSDRAVGADAVFDCVKVLGSTDKPQRAIYGGHPNAEGCRAWAEALAPVLRTLMMKADAD